MQSLRDSYNGGNIALGIAVSPRKGVVTETCFPYTGKNNTRRYCSNPAWTLLANRGYLTPDTTIPTRPQSRARSSRAAR